MCLLKTATPITKCSKPKLNSYTLITLVILNGFTKHYNCDYRPISIHLLSLFGENHIYLVICLRKDEKPFSVNLREWFCQRTDYPILLSVRLVWKNMCNFQTCIYHQQTNVVRFFNVWQNILRNNNYNNQIFIIFILLSY